MIPAALALASVLVAFFLGTQVRRGTEGREVLLAQAVIRGDITRGVEDVALDVTNGGTRQAFVTDPAGNRVELQQPGSPG